MVVALGGCASESAHCTHGHNGAEICEQDHMAASWCRQERGGQPHSANDSEDPDCSGLGYEVSCGDQCVPNADTESCGSLFSAASEADCATAFPPGG